MVVVSMGIGIYLGFGLALRSRGKAIQEERDKTLKALQAVFRSTEELSSDVDAHTRDLVSVERRVEQIETPEDFGEAQKEIIHQISAVIKANRKLEE